MRPDVKQLVVNIKQYFLISALYFIVFMGFFSVQNDGQCCTRHFNINNQSSPEYSLVGSSVLFWLKSATLDQRKTFQLGILIATRTKQIQLLERNNHYSPMEQFLGKSITNIK